MEGEKLNNTNNINNNIWGYLRVSTEKQNIENNKGEILRFANEKGLYPINWISETVSGRKDWRKRELGRAMDNLIKNGDTIIVTEYSRVGRNMLQSLEFISECNRKNIKLFSTVGDIPQTNSATDNLLLALTSWKSQVERDLIAYRTKIKLNQLKNDGIILGRKKRMILEGKDGEHIENNKLIITNYINNGVKLKIISKNMNCTEMTLRKFIKKHIK